MSNKEAHQNQSIDAIYAEASDWHLNTGDETIHAKRIPGAFRNIKYWTSSVWLIFFFGSYLRWGERQAVLFDIPHRQFHIFGITLMPQDFWMFALLMLFFAILLAVVTAIAGRIFCGFFCFQTVWVDLFTWIETKLEGTPQKRRKLDKAPLDFKKIRIKVIKHTLWLLIAIFTGISFIAWFTDAYQLWDDIFHFQLNHIELGIIALFTAGTYILAGFLREQACFWLCPYARIQGVMIDDSTAVVSYDYHRGEPRGRVNKKAPDKKLGDCVECKQCIAVCPTGIDIRKGQQEGCINCALCMDACDAVMEKLDRPKGLIRYASLNQLEGLEKRSLLKRPRVWVYTTVLSLALIGIGYGLTTIEALELKVIHSRQPLFVLESDGSIQNKYTLKILNKTLHNRAVKIQVTGIKGATLIGAEKALQTPHSTITPHMVFVRVPATNLQSESTKIVFHIDSPAIKEMPAIHAQRNSVFFGPR